MIVAAEKLPAGEHTRHYVIGIAAVTFLQTVDIGIFTIKGPVLPRAEEKVFTQCPASELFASLAGGVDAVYD
jgi:hypothetical protein